MQILLACKDILAEAALTEDSYAIIAGKRIPFWFIGWFIKGFLAFAVFLESFIAIQNLRNGLGYETILAPLHFGLTLGQGLVMYYSLLTETHGIVDVMAYLQEVISESNLPHFIRILTIFSGLTIYFSSKGSDASEKSAQIYYQRNVDNNKLLRTAWMTAQTLFLVSYLVPCVLPICYIFFGQPSPNFWFLPLEMNTA